MCVLNVCVQCIGESLLKYVSMLPCLCVHTCVHLADVHNLFDFLKDIRTIRG